MPDPDDLEARFEVRFLYVAARVQLLQKPLGLAASNRYSEKPRRGGRELHLERLRLRTMLLWLFGVGH